MLRRGRERRRYDRELRHYYTEPALPLYGLPVTWQGQRQAAPAGPDRGGYRFGSLTVSSPRRPRASRLGLIHRSDRGASLTVSTYRAEAYSRHGSNEVMQRVAARDLASRTSRRGAAARRACHSAAILIDGEPRTFQILDADGEWVALLRDEEIFIRLDGSGLPVAEVTLVRITDTGPYLPGAGNWH